jgi:2,3-bisphosphoglycerate-dependent phosphoglycerate mutase
VTFAAFVRHGETHWNTQGRIQGHADIPLSDTARAELGAFTLPAALRNCRWHVSPLSRAVETARLLGPGAFRLEPRLMEMHWGQWEGETLAGLRAANPRDMEINEAQGLHFRPPGGETPAEVQERLKTWFRDIADPGRPVVAVTHKGVIRTVLAMAYDWDMRGKAPVKLDWQAAHLFDVDANGTVIPVALNMPFEPRRG